MLVSRQPLSFKLGGDVLEQVQTFKYLGVLISSSLSWSPHVEAVCIKARKLLGLVYRRFYGLVDTSCMIEIYKSLIHPHLEYAAPVWAPHLTRDIANLEKVQRFGLKLCLKSWDGSYYNHLELAGLPTLENRRNYLKLTTLYKIYHGYFYFPSGNLVPHLGRSNHPSPHSLYLPLARTNAYYYSFFPSAIRLWNELPDWVHTDSFLMFKNYLTLFFC